MKLLIVDDDITTRGILNGFLRRYGDLVTAEDGIEGLRVFQQALQRGHPFNVVFLDIMMPHMDGQEVLARIRELEEEANRVGADEAAKVVMTSALDDSYDIMRAFKNQCDGYLVKPIRQEKLDETLDKLGFTKSIS